MNELLKNTVIECLDLAHGQEIKKFFEEKWMNVYGCNFRNTQLDNDTFRFYGCKESGEVISYSLGGCKTYNLRIATIDELRSELEEQQHWSEQELKELEAQKEPVKVSCDNCFYDDKPREFCRTCIDHNKFKANGKAIKLDAINDSFKDDLKKEPEQPKTFPRMMWVWDNDESKKEKAIVLHKLEGSAKYPFIAVLQHFTESYEKGGEYNNCQYKNASEIHPEIEQLESQIKELTDKLNELKKTK